MLRPGAAVRGTPAAGGPGPQPAAAEAGRRGPVS